MRPTLWVRKKGSSRASQLYHDGDRWVLLEGPQLSQEDLSQLREICSGSEKGGSFQEFRLSRAQSFVQWSGTDFKPFFVGGDFATADKRPSRAAIALLEMPLTD